MIPARHIERIVTWGLYALLFTPLVFWHETMHPLGTAKTLFFEIITLLLFAAYIPLAVSSARFRPLQGKIFGAFALFIAVVAATSAFGVDLSRSIWDIPERMVGVFFLLHLLAFFTMLSGMLRTEAAWRGYFSWSAGISFFVALFPALQLFFPAMFFDVAAERFSGTIGNPIFLAAYLLFHVFIAGHLATQFRAAHSRVAASAFAVIGLFDLCVVLLTQTRGAFVALLASFFFLSVSYLIRPYGADLVSPRRGRAIICAVWGAIILLSAFFIATRGNPAWEGVPVFGRLSVAGLQAGPRLFAWRAGLAAFADRPIAGWGLSNFTYGFNAHYDPSLLRHGFGETFFDKPHNIFVQLLSETGILGFVSYLIFFFLLFRRSGLRAPWLTALFIAYLVQNFFAFDTLTSYIMFAILAAYAAFSSNGGERSERHSSLSVPLLLVCFAASGYLIYSVQCPIWLANRAEWTAINNFIQRKIPEGKEAFDIALAVKTPYIDYVRRDLAPMIGQMHQQNVGLPDERALIARAAEELQLTMRNRPLQYGFRVGFAEFVTTVHDIDPSYLAEAESALREAEVLSPRRQTTLYLMSKIAYLNGDKAGALDALRRATLLDPEIGDPYFYYGMMLLENGDASGAARALDRADELGRRAKNVAEARMLGAYFGDADDYVRSIRYFSQALLLEPDDLETKTKLGLVYYLAGDYDAARNILRTVMKTEDLTRSPQYPVIKSILRELGL